MGQKYKPSNGIKTVYTPEYRAEAVTLALASESPAEAARNLGISARTLRGWLTLPCTWSPPVCQALMP